MADAFNPSAGGSGAEAGQPGLRSEFQDTQGYVARPYLKIKSLFIFICLFID